MTPRVFPSSSGPVKLAFFFSTSAGMFSPSPEMEWTHSILPRMSREAMTSEQISCSFTAWALAPGALKTTMPSSVQRSTGMLL